MLQTFGELTQSESHESLKKIAPPNTGYSHSHQATLSKTPQVLVENQGAQENQDFLDKEYLKKQAYLKTYVKNNLKVYEQVLQENTKTMKPGKMKEQLLNNEHAKLFKKNNQSPVPKQLSPR